MYIFLPILPVLFKDKIPKDALHSGSYLLLSPLFCTLYPICQLLLIFSWLAFCYIKISNKAKLKELCNIPIFYNEHFTYFALSHICSSHWTLTHTIIFMHFKVIADISFLNLSTCISLTRIQYMLMFSF